MILHILNKSCILASAEACDRRTQSAGPATLTFGTSANIFKLVRCRHSHGCASAIVSAAAAIAAAKADPAVAAALEGKQLVKEIYVKGRLVNLAVKG